MFNQSSVTNGIIQFVQDGSSQAPSYKIIATDLQSASSLPSSSLVSFTPSSTANDASASSSSSTMSFAAAAGAAGGVVAGAAALALVYRRNQRETKRLLSQEARADSIRQNRHVVLERVAEEVFKHIKLTGFLQHTGQAQIRAYLQALLTILEALAAMGVNIDLATMADKSKASFLEEFPMQIRVLLGSPSGSKGTMFFKPEFTPEQIQEHAQDIAEAIKASLDQKELMPDQPSSRHFIPSQRKARGGFFSKRAAAATVSPSPITETDFNTITLSNPVAPGYLDMTEPAEGEFKTHTSDSRSSL